MAGFPNNQAPTAINYQSAPGGQQFDMQGLMQALQNLVPMLSAQQGMGGGGGGANQLVQLLQMLFGGQRQGQAPQGGAQGYPLAAPNAPVPSYSNVQQQPPSVPTPSAPITTAPPPPAPPTVTPGAGGPGPFGSFPQGNTGTPPPQTADSGPPFPEPSFGNAPAFGMPTLTPAQRQANQQWYQQHPNYQAPIRGPLA